MLSVDYHSHRAVSAHHEIRSIIEIERCWKNNTRRGKIHRDHLRVVGKRPDVSEGVVDELWLGVVDKRDIRLRACVFIETRN